MWPISSRRRDGFADVRPLDVMESRGPFRDRLVRLLEGLFQTLLRQATEGPHEVLNRQSLTAALSGEIRGPSRVGGVLRALWRVPAPIIALRAVPFPVSTINPATTGLDTLSHRFLLSSKFSALVCRGFALCTRLFRANKKTQKDSGAIRRRSAGKVQCASLLLRPR